MIKRRGQRPDGLAPASLKRLSDTEYAAYSEAFGAIKGDYQTLCLMGNKLRKVEMSAQNLGPVESQTQPGHPEIPDSVGDRSTWEVCASLMRLDRNEVLLCKRICEHGFEYAVIDHAPAASAYGKARGPLEILRTGDNPRQVLRDYLQCERDTLQLMANDISANVRLLISERFPKQDLRRVVNEITGMCKKVACLAFSETPADQRDRKERINHSVRI